MINVVYFDASHIETILDRLRWKSSPVLYAVEAFLFHGGHQLTIDNDSRGSVTVVGVNAKYSHRVSFMLSKLFDPREGRSEIL